MLYSRSLGQSFIELFSGMNIIVLAFVVVGIMLVIVEFNCTSNRILGAIGGALIVAGIVVRMFFDGSFDILFTMILLIAAILFAAHILTLRFQKKNWLVHSLGIAVEGRGGDTVGYNYLKNQSGTATTDINPTGHIAIGEINFFVSASEFIEKGSRVRVIEADGVKIVVKPVGEASQSINSGSASQIFSKDN